MKKRPASWMLLSALLVSSGIFAQADSTLKKEKVQFKFGVYYNSGLNYYGRTDSLRSSGAFPLAEIWFNKHLYINAAPVFVINKVSNFEYAGTVTTAGYMFRTSKWAGNTYLVKPFYRSNSQLVQSALKAQLATSFSRLTKIVNISAGIDFKYSDKLDFGATAGLDHLFRFQTEDEIVFVFDPSVYINAGTQQFTRVTYKYILPGFPQEVTEEIKKINILSYEFSMPVVLSKGKFQLILIPAYVIPQNLVTIPNRPDLSERGKEMFYATLGAKLNF